MYNSDLKNQKVSPTGEDLEGAAKPIITGLMAYGMSGKVFHAPFLTTNPGFKLKAIVERHNKIAQERYPKVLSYDSVDELLADNEIELIVVNTPNNTHLKYAIKALDAGKHVLLEKPAAVTSAEVKILFDHARTKNLHVMLYQNRRYDSGFLQCKEVVESGRLGELIEVHFRFDRYKTAIGPKAFKEKKETPANGLVYDLGPHLVDNAIALFGRPLSFHKTTGIYRENSEVVDYFHYHLKYPNQLNVFLTSGLLMAEVMPGFAIYGSLGSFVKQRNDVQEAQLISGMLPNDPAFSIEPDGSEGKLVIMDFNNKPCVELLTPPHGDYQGLFEAVHHTVRDNALFPITEEQIAWQLELLEA